MTSLALDTSMYTYKTGHGTATQYIYTLNILKFRQGRFEQVILMVKFLEVSKIFLQKQYVFNEIIGVFTRQINMACVIQCAVHGFVPLLGCQPFCASSILAGDLTCLLVPVTDPAASMQCQDMLSVGIGLRFLFCTSWSASACF